LRLAGALHDVRAMRAPRIEFALCAPVLVLLLTACAGPAPSADASTAPPTSYVVEWGERRVAPGVEGSKCVVKSLGNDRPVRVNVVHSELGPTSHHLLVYRSDEDEQLEPFDCVSFVDALSPHYAPMFIAQKHTDTVTLPPGVAFTIQPGQRIRLELHYINTTDDDSDARARVTFETLDESAFQAEASFFFIGTPDVLIPPHVATSLGPLFFPMPGGFEDARFFAITGHQHRQGVGVHVETATGPDAPGTPVYEVEDFRWNEPATVYHDPPFMVPSGGGFRFSCDWDNTTDRTLRYGGSSLDEMCMFWAYYYPSQGTRVCFHSEVPIALDSCCPGAPGCDVIF
jgi:hypothetical protein